MREPCIDTLHCRMLKVRCVALSARGLGCVKTQTCCGAVEWRSQASDVLSFSREARLSAPTDAVAQKPRELRGSYTSGARRTSSLSCYYASSRRWVGGVLK